MTDDFTDIRGRQDGLEGRVAVLEAQVNDEASLRAAMDDKLGKATVKLKAHEQSFNSLRETQVEQGKQLTNIELAIGHTLGEVDKLGARVGRLEKKVSDMDIKLASVDERLGAVDERLGGVEERVGAVEGRLDGIDARLDGIDGQLERVDGRLDGIDGRLDRVDGRLDGIGGRLDRVEGSLGEVKDGVAAILSRLDKN